jgi:ATP-binding cassette subfamily B protein
MNFIRLYLRVLRLLGPEARLAAAIAIGNLAMAGAQFAEPILFGRIIDALASAQAKGALPSWNGLAPLLGTWVGFGLFTIVSGALIALHADRLTHRRRQRVMTDYFEHILQLPLSYHSGAHSGRLLKIMLNGTDSLWLLWLGFFRDHFGSFVVLLVLLPLTAFLNWRLALLLMLLCVVFTALILLVLRKTELGQLAVERHYSDVAERTSDALGNVALVQSFARIETEVQGVRSAVEKLLAAQMPVLSWWALFVMFTRASTTFTMLAIFVVGIWLYMDGVTTIGQIVTFTALSGMLIARLEQAVAFANRLFMDAPRLREFFAVADTEPEVRDRPDAVEPGRLRGLIEFKDVSYSYDGRMPAVSDLNFTVLPGELVALVGPTGAGKSTALALLHRVFDPQSGVVQIDGMDIKALKLVGLRRNIGVVFQETLLFNRSIGENIMVGDPNASVEQIRKAATRAQALDFIERNPDGFEGRAGERGRMLSGGERQRIAIARALLKDPPILILDEATSALDATTEIKVQAALDEVMKDRTTFVIAHRLSTVRNAKRILVFDHGRVVESGTFDELVARGGMFATLARAQFLVSSPPPQPVTSDAAE